MSITETSGGTDVDDTGLQQTLQQRHMTLIALGGVIGAGLFVGSGVVVHDTGPAAVVSFALAGVLAILVMRMLGEMAASHPSVGSFYEYARIALGDRAGFTIGWLYWYFWVIVVAVEAVAGAGLLHAWAPSVPLWTLSLVLMLVLTLSNLTSARSYGEFEFWLSSIKIAAICAFIVLGACFLLGLWAGDAVSPGLDNLTAHGGFAPKGLAAVLSGVVPAVAFFTGAEIATIAAAESREPRKAVARATNSVVLRVLVFYVGSVFLVVAIRPWDSQETLDSPYISALSAMHVPAADTIMRAVVLTAVLSALNSGLYTSSRILFALTRRGDAPSGFARLSRGGVPVRAILAGTVLGYVSVVVNYVSPGTVFAFLIHSYGAVALFVYLLIALSQLRMRAQLEREAPEGLPVRMWLYPYLSWLTVGAMVLVIACMGVLPSTRADLGVSLLTLVVVLGAYEVRRRRHPVSA